jgi:putative ABC transport system permease protein
MTAAPRWMTALILLYPRAYRERHGAELAAAMAAVAERERAAGKNALATALRLTLDAVSSAVIVHRASHHVSGAPRASGDPLMQSIWYDVRYALRAIRRAPLFSALTVATLAIVLGANTAIFSVVNSVLLRSLPYSQPERLVVLYEGISTIRAPFGFSPPDYAAFAERTRSYERLAAFRSVEYELSGVDQPERIPAARVSAAVMDVLGIRPALGRMFTVEEDTGRQPVAVLNDRLWRRKFGADSAVIGKPVMLDRRSYTIVGVMPPGFTFPNRGPRLNSVPADIYVPIAFTDGELRAFGSMYNNSVVARLKPGVSVDQARAEGGLLTRQNAAGMYPAELRELVNLLTTTVVPLRDEIVGSISRILYVLLAAVGAVLLIACADLAALMLTRASAREREMAIRTALGAGRGRVMRLVLVETGVLATAGAASGLPVAWWAQRTLIGLSPVPIPRGADVSIDARVVVFTLGVSLLAALACGLLPALDASRRDSGTALKEGGRTGTMSTHQRRTFAVLVTAQFACAIVLLAAGGLLIRSFVRLMSIDPGIKTDHVITAATNLPGGSYPQGSDVRSFYTRLVDEVRRMPGVTAAGASTDLPLTVRERRNFAIETPPQETAAVGRLVAASWVMGQYSEAVGMRVVRGRALNDGDTRESEPVIVINETMAKRYWGGHDPVGQRIAWGGPQNHSPWIRVVGIMGDVKQAGLASVTEAETWQPWVQVDDASLGGTIVGMYRGMRLMVRSTVPPESLVASIRQQVRAIDPALPVTAVQTLDEVLGASAGTQRFNAALLGGFAGIALLLAALGVGGVLAITVSQRTQEIGVRLALGARAADVMRMVIWQGMLLVAAGLVIGLPCAFAATRLLRTLLFETPPYDVLTFAAATAVLCGVALAACAAPALRASHVSPMRALRMD